MVRPEHIENILVHLHAGQWFGWDVVKVGPIKDKAVYDAAKIFAERVSKGQVVAKHGSDESTNKELPF